MRRGLFCIEGEWDLRLSQRRSVRPIVEFLEGTGAASRTVYRTATTEHEVARQLDRWRRNARSYPVLYLATHGASGVLSFSQDFEVPLIKLATLVDPWPANAIVLLGSCSTMRAPDDVLQDFVRSTKVRALAGYRRTNGFVEGSAFDITVLDEFLGSERIPDLVERVARLHPVTVDRFGLRVATRAGVLPESR